MKLLQLGFVLLLLQSLNCYSLLSDEQLADERLLDDFARNYAEKFESVPPGKESENEQGGMEDEMPDEDDQGSEDTPPGPPDNEDEESDELFFQAMLANIQAIAEMKDEGEYEDKDEDTDVLLESEGEGQEMKRLSGDVGDVQYPEDISSRGFSLLFEAPLKVSDLETNGWKMVFRAASGNGIGVYDAFTDAKKTTSQKPLTMQRSRSPYHYRDWMVDSWSNVRYVKLALYDEKSELAYIIFNGQSSGKTSWFNQHRVITSSWSDLTSSDTYNFFSLDGHRNLYRRFFINRRYTGCDNDLGHLVVKESRGANCRWDSQPVYPQFLYSRINSADVWNRLQFGRADYLAIFVQI